MLVKINLENADDYIIAIDEANSLQDFVAGTLPLLGFLDWRDHVSSDSTLFRPTDLAWSQGCADKAFRDFGWNANFKIHDVVRSMIKSAQADIFLPLQSLISYKTKLMCNSN